MPLGLDELHDLRDAAKIWTGFHLGAADVKPS